MSIDKRTPTGSMVEKGGGTRRTRTPKSVVCSRSGEDETASPPSLWVPHGLGPGLRYFLRTVLSGSGVVGSGVSARGRPNLLADPAVGGGCDGALRRP